MNRTVDFVSDVNTTDLLSAIELGCRTMANVFNRDDNDIPFMSSCVWPNAHFGYSSAHAECHIPGRHLNALLTAEAAAGIPVDESVVQKHAAAAFYSFSGPIPLPLNRLAENNRPVGKPVHFLDHNIREGFHALYALSRYRHDARADEMMRRAIAFLFEHYVPDMAFDVPWLESLGLDVMLQPYIAGVARAIGPLVKYWRSSGYAPALELAEILARRALEHYPADGAFNQEQMGTAHAHSITCVMSSLAQLADATTNAELLRRVQAFYDNGLNQLRNEIGWAAEITTPAMHPVRGEVNTSGDIVETALILGKHFGNAYYEDAERIVRSHILPSQLRDVSFIREPENPDGEDMFRDVATRHIGAFGFPAPYGHHPLDLESISFNMDIVGGAVGSLCEVLTACTSYENGVHRINLLFDSHTDAIDVLSPYTRNTLIIRTRRAGAIYLRLPSWAAASEVRVDGASWRFTEGGICIPDPTPEAMICVYFPLTERDLVLHHSTVTVKARFRGDCVIAMENEGTDLAFFPAL